jgi:predicted lipoprotein with Yx(FWY)xxD motif
MLKGAGVTGPNGVNLTGGEIMLKRLGQGLGFAGIALFAISSPLMAAEVDEMEDTLAVEQLMAEESEDYGEYLVTEDGRSVYMFDADSEGESACYDDCAAAWPPLTAWDNGALETGDNVDEEMIDTIDRDDGIEQVTYDGQPLYVFVRDTEAGDVSGQEVEGFGGTWYLVSPDGGQVGEDHSDAVGSDPMHDDGADATDNGGMDGNGDATDDSDVTGQDSEADGSDDDTTETGDDTSDDGTNGSDDGTNGSSE